MDKTQELNGFQSFDNQQRSITHKEREEYLNIEIESGSKDYSNLLKSEISSQFESKSQQENIAINNLNQVLSA